MRALAIVSPEPLAPEAVAILERCGFVPVRFATSAEALKRVGRAFAVEIVLVDGRELVADSGSDELHAVLAFARTTPWTGEPLPVALLAGPRLAPAVREACDTFGVHVIPPYRQRPKTLARMMVRLCGGNGRCCAGHT